ncbi:hypothetical protein [Streptacidiphilus melanogenes]|uniref:hypothetical protein n=1 Tax=Streptacidiphilus melanogenes TaxID=411235 RepID=UPI0005A99FEA|nr:hypothetical protein [Streptacidiphilus melanogenes]
MAFEEKRAWILGLVSLVSYAVYLLLVLGRSGGGELAHTPYVSALLWTVAGSILASVALSILVAVADREGGGGKDQRDREIHRFGMHVGQGAVVLGSVCGLLLALARCDQFWIANALYLGLVLSAVLGSTARIAAYRWGFQPW